MIDTLIVTTTFAGSLTAAYWSQRILLQALFSVLGRARGE